jgi:putative aldouronate transport system substrate-binding protein
LSYQDEVKAVNPNAETKYMWWPVGPSGTSGAMSNNYINAMFAVHINTPKKTAERIFQIIDWFQTPEGTLFQNYGLEGKHWVEKDGKIYPAPGVDPEHPAYRGQLYINAGAAWNNFKESSLIRPPLFSECRQAALRGDYPTIDAQDYMLPYNWTNTKSEDLIGDLDKMYDQMYAKVLTGELPVSYIDEWIVEWRKKGGDIYIQECTEQYKKLKARY